jgi:hypothetical protein
MPYKTAFISHAHADNAKCDPYASTLQRRGINLSYDRSNPQVGQSLSKALEKEIQRAMVLIVMVTPAALTSFWVSEEIDMFLSLMAQDRTRLLIPVKLEPCTLPPRLASRWWVDATTQSLAQVVEQLVDALEEDSLPDISSPRLPSSARATRSTDQPVVQTKLPTMSIAGGSNTLWIMLAVIAVLVVLGIAAYFLLPALGIGIGFGM